MLFSLALVRWTWFCSRSLNIGLKLYTVVNALGILSSAIFTGHTHELIALLLRHHLSLSRLLVPLYARVIIALRVILDGLGTTLSLSRVLGVEIRYAWTYGRWLRLYPCRPKPVPSSTSSSIKASIVQTLGSRTIRIVLAIFLLMILDVSTPVFES